MDFYKEANVFNIAANGAGATLDMSGATFNHKAIMFQTNNPSGIGNSVQLKFGSVGGKSTPINFIADGSTTILGNISTTNLANAILPSRVVEIKNNTGQILTIALLN
jgi:hypothetical protein